MWIRSWKRLEPNLWRTEEEEVEGREGGREGGRERESLSLSLSLSEKGWKSLMQNFCNLEHIQYMKREKPAD